MRKQVIGPGAITKEIVRLVERIGSTVMLRPVIDLAQTINETRVLLVVQPGQVCKISTTNLN